MDFPEVEVKASQAYWSGDAEAFDFGILDFLRQPYDNLVDTIEDVLEVIRSPHAEFFGSTLGRMAFIQLFAAMEAFLTDTLLERVLTDRDRLARVLAGVNDLKAVKLSLSDILADPEIVQHKVAEEIHKMSFHNFNKTDAVWNVAFGHSIFKNQQVRERLLRYVGIRHDCVHRNGKSEEGIVSPVDFSLVREVAHHFKGTALYIEGQFEGTDFEAGLLDEAPPII